MTSYCRACSLSWFLFFFFWFLFHAESAHTATRDSFLCLLLRTFFSAVVSYQQQPKKKKREKGRENGSNDNTTNSVSWCFMNAFNHRQRLTFRSNAASQDHMPTSVLILTQILSIFLSAFTDQQHVVASVWCQLPVLTYSCGLTWVLSSVKQQINNWKF